MSSAREREAILTFINTYKDPKGGGSHPEEEANIIIRLLSMFLNSRIKKKGLRINEIDIPVANSQNNGQYARFFGIFDHTNLGNFIQRTLSLDEDLARQFIRACHTYSFALEFIPSDPTFAFFLLVVSGECMSSQNKIITFSDLNPACKSCERFCKFITTFLLDEFKGDDEENDDLFYELLKTIYYSHRSGFAHGGKEIPAAALMADMKNSSYFKHATDGKEIKTPGLGWFAK